MIYMMISAMSNSIMSFLLKLLFLNSNINAFEVTYWQSMIVIVFEYMMIRSLKKDPFKVPDGIRITFVLRNVTGFFGTVGYFIAI